MEPKIKLRLGPGTPNRDLSDVYYPRIQINDQGEIILAVSKSGSLTSGILVGKTADSKSIVPIGRKFTDWEVAGELQDYPHPVSCTFQNEINN